MNTEIYAIDRFWSDVPLNGADPAMLITTDVAKTIFFRSRNANKEHNDSRISP